LDKQYDKAVGCLDAFMQALEKDAALLTLKSLIQHAGGDVAAARASLQEALELEPDCVYARAKGLDVLLAAKDYRAVRDSMIFLEKKGGYHFKGAMTGPVWDDFKKSPESAPWR
jgi:tetratricopeptide (TPR) repeat protein